MSQNDSDFYKPFIWVLGALVVFTVFIAIVANIFSPKNDYSTDELVQQGVKKQIAPVGSSRVAEAAPAQVVQPVAEAESAATDEAAPEAEESSESEEKEEKEETDAADMTAESAEVTESVVNSDGTKEKDKASEQVAVVEAEPVAEAVSAVSADEVPLKVRAVVATNCAGCHMEGVKGAQRNDDTAAWQALSAKGLDALTTSVINGKGEMLPRAETSLNDEEIALAVRYMVTQATGEPVGDAPAESVTPAAATEEDPSASVEEAKVDEAPKNDSAATTEETAETPPEAPPETTVKETKEDSSAASSESATEATAVTEVVTAEIASVVAATPANVQAVADGLCAGCHISGVANAPKIGDKAAWDERLAGGMDALLASVIAGKGAMPARGGSQLSDAELRQAIEYLAKKE